MKEIWADIAGYNGTYQVSTLGKVRNKYGKVLFQCPNAKGYMRVKLIKNGRRTHKRVNRLVAETFISNPFNLPQVNHINGDKQDNSISNLEWVTNRDNVRHAYNMRSLKGIKQGQITLNDYLKGDIKNEDRHTI